MLRNNADVRRCSYFELGLPVALLICLIIMRVFPLYSLKRGYKVKPGAYGLLVKLTSTVFD